MQAITAADPERLNRTGNAGLQFRAQQHKDVIMNTWSASMNEGALLHQQSCQGAVARKPIKFCTFLASQPGLPEWGEAGPRANHDDGRDRAAGQPEVWILVDVDWHSITHLQRTTKACQDSKQWHNGMAVFSLRPAHRVIGVQ